MNRESYAITVFLACTYLLLLPTSCNYLFKPSLKGKRLYTIQVISAKLAGAGSYTAAFEVEMYFIGDSQVDVTVNAKTKVSYLPVTSITHHATVGYTYRDNVLTMAGEANKAMKLTESDTFYTDEAGQLYYKMPPEGFTDAHKAELLKKAMQHPAQRLQLKF